MNRNYFFIPGLVNEKAVLEDAMEKTIEGDNCLVHYHRSGQPCNMRCHTVELPKESEGEIL